MKKHVILCWGAMLILAFGISSCSSSDDEDSSITVYFQLKDEDGMECYSFKEGDNIVFRLDVINNGKEDVIIHHDIGYIIGNDIFHVYSSKGEDFGTPYDMLIIPEVGLTMIP